MTMITMIMTNRKYANFLQQLIKQQKEIYKENNT